ncbi:MAG: 16S rRNA (guanine527-N7)-methyltransferase [Myxococcota bacterium]|jgi:16S rRNA (guanine527-N7)-methyltransferase
MTLSARLTAAAETLAVSVPEGAAEKLLSLVAVLAKWNAKIRLVGPVSAQQILDDHVVDGLGFARIVARTDTASWWDIGSGAGLPGLVLATLFPRRHFELVEPITKKTAFITTAVRTLGLTNVTVHTTRMELLTPDETSPKGALSRATFAPDAWYARAAELVGPGGQVIVALGSTDAPDLRARALLTDDYEMPVGRAKRSNLLVQVPL